MDYTRGPWEIDDRQESDWIFIEPDVAQLPKGGPSPANARLLRAAPDLLAALEAHIAYEESVTATIAAISGEKFQEAPWLAAARKAIAKAKGQTEEDELERARR